ncbi:MAG: DUF2807 domain-containing protein [Oscillospiraceae bacterium]|nr:DUF2807 domain-containing protein [Oscillospiraceae bacterium]
MNRYLKTVFCFILCAFLLAGCSFDISGKDITFNKDGIGNAIDAVKPKDVTGEMNFESITPSDGIPVRKLEFENISFTGAEEAKILIIPSDETKVEASYPIRMHEHNFRISVREGEIEISVPKQTNFKADKFEIKIYANIEEIDISGGIALEMDAKNSKRIHLEAKGGADIYIYNIAAESFETDVAGAASMNLSGETENFEVELAGAGALDAKSLICRNADIEISGAGTAEVSVTDKLFADMDGVGSLRYYGDPLVENISAGLTDVEQVSKEVYGG